MGRKLLRMVTLVTTCSIWSVVAATRTVYYSCGAVVDSEARGMILSPGFPTGYAAGMHCVWQFLIPPGVRLDLEVFDFDVFESPGDEISHHSASVAASREGQRGQSPAKEPGPGGRTEVLLNGANASDSKAWKLDQPSTEGTLTVAQAESPQVDDPSLTEAAAGLQDQGETQTGTHPSQGSPAPTLAAPVPLEVCPDDVLYVSDLVTFSVRFCGANSPVNKTLSFGSPLQMVEVVVELITTTDRGRGFLLLYWFESSLDGDLRNEPQPRGHGKLVHFLVLGGVALLLFLLLIAVCRTRRKRTHYKGRCSHCSKNRENGIQNSAVDVGEMQLVVNRTNQDVSIENENNQRISFGRAGNSLHTEMEVTSTESAVTESGSDEIFVISTGPSVGTLHFSSFKTKISKSSPVSSPTVCDWLVPDLSTSAGEKPLMTQGGNGQEDSPIGQQGCNTQKFKDMSRPVPRDWCGWASPGPFAKPVENCTAGSFSSDHHTENQRKVMSDMQLEVEYEQLYSDSSGSAASYPLTQFAQSQRKVTSATNLRRAWFGSPCFGLRSSAPRHNSSTAASCHNWARQSVPHHGPCSAGPKLLVESSGSSNITKGFQIDTAKTRNLATESDRINLTKPVFAISEVSEDREPLVQALDTVGQSGAIGPFRETKPNESNSAPEEQRLIHPVIGES